MNVRLLLLALVFSFCFGACDSTAPAPKAEKTVNVEETAENFVGKMHEIVGALATMRDDTSTTEGVRKMKTLLDQAKQIALSLEGAPVPGSEERKALDEKMTAKSKADRKEMFRLLLEKQHLLSDAAQAELAEGMQYFESTMIEIGPIVTKYCKADPVEGDAAE